MQLLNRITGRITELLSTSNNVLSRTVRTVRQRFWSMFSNPTHDWGRADYAFWRRAFYCRERGLEISGLFIKPLIGKISAWTLGRAPRWKAANDAATEELSSWWENNHAQILQAFRAALKQGDSFLVINADMTVTVLPPDAVDPIVADDDFANIIGWRVTQIITHPTQVTQRMIVTDEYYADRRLHKVEISGRLEMEQEFPNLLDRLPIVHIPNQADDGETFGHAEAEALLETLHRYGAVLEASIDGNILQGRPTPVAKFETIADLDKFWDNYGEEQTQTLPDGSTQTIETLNVDLSQMLTLSAGEFDYKSPGSFTEDTERLLGLLFYLILEHTEIPEFVFGNAISSSRASAETQMPVWESFIEMRRGDIQGWLVEIAEIALAYLSLITPGVSAETPSLQWPVMTQDGRLTLDTLQWALLEGLLDDRTALMLAPIDVQDVDEVLESAQQQREERMAQQPQMVPDTFDQDLAAEIEALEMIEDGSAPNRNGARAASTFMSIGGAV